MLRSVCLSALLVPSLALAVPTTMMQQGRLLDALGNPIQGSHDLTFHLYDDATTGSSQWSETIRTTLDDGYFSVELGHTEPLDTTEFTGADRWLAIAVDLGDDLPGRKKVDSVPYAQRAAVAEQVQWSSIQGIPADIADGDDVLTEAQVETMVTNGPLALDAGTTIGGQGVSAPGSSQPTRGWAAISTDDVNVYAAEGHGETDIPGMSVTVSPTGSGNLLYAHLSANVRLRYDQGDRCEVRIRATGGGFSNTIVGSGDLYHGAPTDAPGHQQSSVAGLLTTSSTSPITLKATIKVVDGNGDNDAQCYVGHRADHVLAVMELSN